MLAVQPTPSRMVALCEMSQAPIIAANALLYDAAGGTWVHQQAAPHSVGRSALLCTAQSRSGPRRRRSRIPKSQEPASERSADRGSDRHRWCDGDLRYRVRLPIADRPSAQKMTSLTMAPNQY